MKSYILVFLFVFGFSKLFAQGSDEKTVMSRCGIGFHVEQLKSRDFEEVTNGMAPLNKLILTINPINSFRFEPELGFRYVKQGSNEATMIGFGIGLFGMSQFNKLNFYGGVRFELDLGTFTRESLNYNGNYNQKIDQTGVSFAPAIGLEYYFYKSFSLGGEISLKYTSISTDTKIFGTDTGLIIRYYF